MATKTVETVVCDVCKTDRPAVATIQVDVCTAHLQKLDARHGGQAFPCDQCDRAFATKQGLTMHRVRTHNVVSLAAKKRAKAARR